MKDMQDFINRINAVLNEEAALNIDEITEYIKNNTEEAKQAVFDEDGNKLLHQLCLIKQKNEKSNVATIIELLLTKGVKINGEDISGENKLQIAIRLAGKAASEESSKYKDVIETLI